MKINSLLVSDGYKQSHLHQYPKGTTLVYSNWTPRNDKHAHTKDGVVVFGIQAVLMQLKEHFDRNFFNLPKSDVVASFKQGYYEYFGEEPDVTHLVALHDLGYLPITVKSLPEGSICPIGVPMLTIYNSHSKFFWVTNFLETILSTDLWLGMTSATIAKGYKDSLLKWSELTCIDKGHIPFQAHDFSMRGMAGLWAASVSGAGHLLSFVGSDTIPAVYYLKKYYNADVKDGIIGCSIPATEHSVMSMGTKDDELGTFRRLITETYPNGLVSIVSDTWNLWKVLTDYVPALKTEILAREGKVVIRPDSGDPVDIICGTIDYTGQRGKSWEENSKWYNEKYGVYNPKLSDRKGVIELLWDTFGGTTNSKGFKVLDSHIGAIYGDAISLERQEQICARLAAKGFASSNIVFGIGSYTYQFNTRDTYGFAMKATYGEVDGVGREIFKDPITGDGTKKSLVGLLSVQVECGKYVAKDRQTWAEEETGELKTIFNNGHFLNLVTLKEIRERLSINE